MEFTYYKERSQHLDLFSLKQGKFLKRLWTDLIDGYK